MSLTGRDLWNCIEQKAREKLGKDYTWELRAVNIVDNEIAGVTLRKGNEKVRGLVVYKEAE